MSTKTPRDPDSFAWGDLCDIYGTPYRIGDQYTLDSPLPSFDAQLGPATLLWLETPPDDDTETDYVYGRPLDPSEVGGWTHYKLRELTIHRGTRVPPAEVLRMIDAFVEANEGNGSDDRYEFPEWVAKARARVAELTGPDGDWTDR